MCVVFSLLAVKASVDALDHHLEHELLLKPYFLNLNLKAEICSIIFQDCSPCRKIGSCKKFSEHYIHFFM